MTELQAFLREKAEGDPTYRPYCMRCRGLVRMTIVAPFYWRCACGGECDCRVFASDSPSPEPLRPITVTTVHEDTLDAITFVCDRLEEHAFEQSYRYDQDDRHKCIVCGQPFRFHSRFGKPATPEDERHDPACELVAKVKLLRAFVRAESAPPLRPSK